MTVRTFLLLLFSAQLASAQQQHSVGWIAYNGNRDGDHYSTLKQINRTNVHSLQQAWRFDTGEKGQIQTNPLIIKHTLYAYTPSQKVIALDAATGRLQWKFDSGINGTQPARGLAYFNDGVHGRIFAGIMNYLYCLDILTGKPIASFGEQGRIDLRKDLGRPYETQSIALTTPGIIYKDLIIVGGRDPETHPAPPGFIRAYDVHTGALRWTFHTIPQPGEPGYETWPKDSYLSAGAANNWAGMSLDVGRGILYAPTGSAVMDFYGGDRLGNDLYANCVLALDAATGKLIWYFQGVHHDLWDRDFPAPPALYTLQPRDGPQIDALAQTTKQGYLYLFNRVTGVPIAPIHEVPYPASAVPGEVTSPTQPKPDWPEPFAARQQLTEDQLTNRTPEAHAWAVKTFRSMKSGGAFFPMGVDSQTLVFPGYDGGAEWGGPAIDPVHRILYVNENEMAWTGGLIPAAAVKSHGEFVFRSQCAVCHGVDRAGSPPAMPSLLGIHDQLTDDEITAVVRSGRGRMPSFPNIDDRGLRSLLHYLDNQPEEQGTAEGPSPDAYIFTGYRKFLDPDGYPAIAPPWGTLNSIDLKTGRYLWKIPFGEYPDLVAQGITNTGSENYGGPVVTAGGVLFIGATVYDRKFHAFDASTGKLLWETTLPFAGMATPATYMLAGRQYVVTVSSGGRDPKSPVGGSYIAFALPEASTAKK
ncbi:MAG TPA: PQQ-binding-like beta-propeller repeat protein [Terracidiphilus sp.]|jgi:quinoprotein glucose dehydrogenase|nr:PQQ-binding-like beta-propeller repeat protein [Terracidiphilus sp.]